MTDASRGGDAGQPAFLEQLERAVLGGERRYNRLPVAERAGVPIERAERLWRSVLVGRELAAALADQSDYQLRKLRRVSVRGYRRLEPWVLRPA